MGTSRMIGNRLGTETSLLTLPHQQHVAYPDRPTVQLSPLRDYSHIV
jgi:hypothetical protein